ncbi:hypothetical protein BDQ17DRAFT_1425296 [Cyathus striatus]|nr:hypothetical protein BDQ17DRAFT_1425296 [Cyathus striatus]
MSSQMENAFSSPNCRCVFSYGFQTNPGSSRAEIELQISRIEEWINSLVRRKAILKQRLNSYSLVSELLPREVLSEIFIWACELGYSSPILLGNVCQSWRHISESTPCLWRCINFTPKQVGNPEYLDILLKWIKLGKEYPRTFKAPLVYWDDVESLNKLFEALVWSSSNWQSIFSSNSFGLIPFVGHELDLRALKIFEISFNTRVAMIPLGSAARAPKLREVRIWSSKLPLFEAIKLPWAQIESFASNLRPVSEYLHIFKSTPFLRRCFLMSVCDNNLGAATTYELPISIPSLQLLQMRNTLLNTCFFFLDKISAPKLEAVSFFCCVSLSCESFASSLIPWSSTLRHIEFSNCSIAEKDIISLLESTLSLVELRVISSGCFTNELIAKLISKPEFSSGFLPNLRILEINSLIGDPSLVARMLYSRRSYTCLEYADISMKYSVYDDFEDVKKSIRELGNVMQLSLSVYGDSWFHNIPRDARRSVWWDIDVSDS